jgi:hypothetical protein
MSDPPEICAFEVSVCAHGHIHVWMRDEADCIVGIAGLGAVDADTLAAALKEAAGKARQKGAAFPTTEGTA